MRTAVVMIAGALMLAACGESEKVPANGAANNDAANNNASNNGDNNTANNASTNGVSNNDTTITAAPTYWEDVKPIIDAKCADCHTPGAIGPFPLTTYAEVADVSGLVKAEVSAKTMPPFIYDNLCREYTHDPTLSDEELETVVAWVDAGSPEGDPTAEGEPIVIELPEPPVFDTSLTMPEPYTPRQSPDDYRCFVVDWPHDTTRYVTGFGVEPGDDGIVHHVIGFLAPPSAVAEAEALDAAEEGPGYTCFGTANISQQSWIGSWAPGGIPAKFAPGSGVPVEPGSKMIIQVHYNTLTEEPRPDLTTLHFETKESVEREGVWMPWANPQWLNGNMRIAAGDADATHSFMFDPTQFISNGQPIRIWGGGLHMHLLGTSIRAWILRADGSESCLVESPRFDFNWQQGVMFQEPITLNPGDRLGLECHWDNSMANQPIVNGERVTPADRGWGEGTLDEMCLGVFYVTN